VVQRAGVLPNSGNMNFVNIGSTKNRRVALKKVVVEKRSIERAPFAGFLEGKTFPSRSSIVDMQATPLTKSIANTSYSLQRCRYQDGQSPVPIPKKLALFQETES
jgi:hypothetical protein